MTTEEPIITEAPKKRDFYFSFTDEAAAATALQPFYHQPQVQSVDPNTGEKLYDAETGEPVMEDDGDAYLVMHSHNHSFDIVGLIHEPTGTMLTDAEGMEYPEMAPIPGWHVNLRIRGDYMRDEAEAIDAVSGVEPATPHRTWL
jgi:hypothetical protein